MIDKLIYSEIPITEKWRIDFTNELLSIKKGTFEAPGFTYDEECDMLEYVCIS